ncbi:hypothetical protein LJK88_02385 [Paenibacillus sp. P26]|nr:hypothetical protein LJK88_02385 [Paenibacillus sp. P26]UUZ90977.1 hypothetical protein LJK87_35105 [Paenibacillus sp. P25]
MKSLFSELGGFVVYEPVLLKRYLDANHLLEQDILQYFTGTDHGEIITKKGIAIPIIGVNTGYYHFDVTFGSRVMKEEEVKASSSGWVYYTESGRLSIVGIGYLTNRDSLESNSLTFRVDEGWYSVEILCGEKEGRDELWIELVLHREDDAPKFSGNFETDYSY